MHTTEKTLGTQATDGHMLTALGIKATNPRTSAGVCRSGDVVCFMLSWLVCLDSLCGSPTLSRMAQRMAGA